MPDAEFLSSACASQDFEGVTSDKWACAKNAVRDRYGIVVNTDSGTASKDGFTLTWNYNPGAQTLQVQCTDSPWWAPCSAINGQIQDIAGSCNF